MAVVSQNLKIGSKFKPRLEHSLTCQRKVPEVPEFCIPLEGFSACELRDDPLRSGVVPGTCLFLPCLGSVSKKDCFGISPPPYPGQYTGPRKKPFPAQPQALAERCFPLRAACLPCRCCTGQNSPPVDWERRRLHTGHFSQLRSSAG